MAPTKNDGLHAGIAAAQRALGSISKDAKNSYQGYDYVSAEQMISECRRALLANGVVFFRSGWKTDLERMVTISTYTVRHISSGEQMTLETEMIVNPSKNQDKSLLAALTTSLSYVLRDLLLIPRIEDDQPEVDNMDISFSQGARGGSQIPSGPRGGQNAGPRPGQGARPAGNGMPPQGRPGPVSGPAGKVRL